MKFDSFIYFIRESVEICVFVTHISTLFYIYTANIYIRQIFLISSAKFLVKEYIFPICVVLSHICGDTLPFAIHSPDFTETARKSEVKNINIKNLKLLVRFSPKAWFNIIRKYFTSAFPNSGKEVKYLAQ